MLQVLQMLFGFKYLQFKEYFPCYKIFFIFKIYSVSHVPFYLYILKSILNLYHLFTKVPLVDIQKFLIYLPKRSLVFDFFLINSHLLKNGYQFFIRQLQSLIKGHKSQVVSVFFSATQKFLKVFFNQAVLSINKYEFLWIFKVFYTLYFLGSEWLYIVPWGLRKLLCHIKNAYGDPTIIITENGCSWRQSAENPDKKNLEDTQRCNYITNYINEALKGLSKIYFYI